MYGFSIPPPLWKLGEGVGKVVGPMWTGEHQRRVRAERQSQGHDQAEMESRLLTPAYDALPQPASAEEAAASAGAATEDMGEDNFTKFMNQAFMAAMLKRKDVPFPGGRVAGSVKAAPGPEPMRRSWEKDYRTL